MKNPIIVIAGPTTSGKTDLAVELAKEFNGEIVNADSRTIYREMDVATSKPEFSRHSEFISESNEILKQIQDDTFLFDGIPHHLFDIVDPDEEFTLADYKSLALKKINDIHSRGKIPFLVGGTGLYIDAVVYDFNLTESTPDPKIRQELEKLSTEELYQKLGELDKLTADNIDPHNKRRLTRALEVIISTNKSFYQSKTRKDKPENILYLAIEKPREELYENINKRIDNWVSEGLLEETENLVSKYSLDLPSMTSIGYKEIAESLKDDGEITTQEALDMMKQRTRNYAKRQMTWLKKNQDIIWVNNTSDAKKMIENYF